MKERMWLVFAQKYDLIDPVCFVFAGSGVGAEEKARRAFPDRFGDVAERDPWAVDLSEIPEVLS